jgi:hypothetical protein
VISNRRCLMPYRRFLAVLALIATFALGGCGVVTPNAMQATSPVIVGAGQFDRTSAAWISLSRSGMVSDTVVTSGSTTPGADQSAKFQAVLDLAANGPINVLVDVAFTCNTTPYIHSNTNLIGLNKSCGWMMGSSQYEVGLANYEVNALRAANSNSFFGVGSGTPRTLGNFCSANIGIRGITINGNSTNNISGVSNSMGNNLQQPSGVRYPYADFIVGLRMWGVDGLVVNDVDIFDFPCYGGWIVNCNNVSIPSLLIDELSAGHLNVGYGQDGLDICGPMGTVRIGKLVIRSNDDGISLGTDPNPLIVTSSTLNFGLGGPFADFDCESLILGINGAPSHFGIRIDSETLRFERCRFGSVSGDTAYLWLFCGSSGPGNMGTIQFGSVDVAITTVPGGLTTGAAQIASSIDYFNIDSFNMSRFPVTQQPAFSLMSGSGGQSTIKTFRIGAVNYLETTTTNAGNLITNVGCNVTHTVIGKGVVGRTGATGSTITALTINTGNSGIGHGIVDMDLVTDGCANAVYLQSGKLSTLKSSGVMSNAGASNGWLNVASGQTVTNHLHTSLGAVVPKSGAGTVTNDVGAGTFGG